MPCAVLSDLYCRIRWLVIVPSSADIMGSVSVPLSDGSSLPPPGFIAALVSPFPVSQSCNRTVPA